MSTLIIILSLLVYLYLLIRWDKLHRPKLGERPSKILKYLHYLALSVVVNVAFLYGLFDLGLRGAWTTRSLIFLTLLTGIFYRFVASSLATNKFERFYFKAFSLIPFVIGVVLLIPFLGPVIVMSLGGQLVEPVKEVLYQDNKVRVQSTFIGVLGPPRVDVFNKHFLFEKHLYRSDFSGFDTKSVKVSYDIDSTRIHFYLEGYESIEHKVLSFKKLKNQ